MRTGELLLTGGFVLAGGLVPVPAMAAEAAAPVPVPRKTAIVAPVVAPRMSEVVSEPAAPATPLRAYGPAAPGVLVPTVVPYYEVGYIHQPHDGRFTHGSLYNPYFDLATENFRRNVRNGRCDPYYTGTRTLYGPGYADPGLVYVPRGNGYGGPLGGPVARGAYYGAGVAGPSLTGPTGYRPDLDGLYGPNVGYGAPLHQFRYSAGGYGYPSAYGPSAYTAGYGPTGYTAGYGPAAGVPPVAGVPSANGYFGYDANRTGEQNIYSPYGVGSGAYFGAYGTGY